jgi:hypothetical protein
MATIVAGTKYVDNGGPYGLPAPSTEVERFTVVLSTADEGVYVGPLSMGEGSSFPTVGSGSSIGGYLLVPNTPHVFDITAETGSEDTDNYGLYVTTSSADGAVYSFLLLEKP